ncbi:MAG: hypothetical protein J7M18_06980 [Candidatus Eremiobacteraeota bacterium]|nr:hypothetical protein [Candidatus Eremiobacteraeota bacterium]
MNLSDLRNKIYIMLHESGNNSIFSESTLNDFINSRYFRVCRARPWSFLLKEAKIELFRTTVSSPSTGNTLNVTSTSGMGIGRKLVVIDGMNSEHVRITGIEGNVITLEGSGLVNTYDSGADVIIDNYFLPVDCWKLLFARVQEEQPKLRITKIDESGKIQLHRSNYGKPGSLLIGGICIDREPFSTDSYSAGSGSDSVSIVCSDLSAITDDYYKGWMMMNITRGQSTRVRSYISDSKTLILENAIPDQAEDDSFYLAPYLTEFFLYPLPDNNITLQLHYRMIPPKLVNDEDVPVIPGAYHILLAYGVMVDLCAADRNRMGAENSLITFTRLEQELFLQMADEYTSVPGAEMLSMDTGDWKPGI